jgi:hypothetical protein
MPFGRLGVAIESTGIIESWYVALTVAGVGLVES